MSLYEFKRQDAFDFARHVGIEAHERGNQLEFKICPYCRGGKKRNPKTFAISLETGQFKCMRGTCGQTGNMLTLAKDFNFSLGRDMDNYMHRRKQPYRKLKQPEKPIVPKPAALSYLEGRGISAETVKRYQVTARTDKPDVLVFPFYDEKGVLQFVKYRNTDRNAKSKEFCEANTKPILFGMLQCNSDNKRLVLTEGQIDSLSVAEAGIENAVSVPLGKLGFTWFPFCYDWLGQFSELVVFGDWEKGEMSLLDEMRRRFHGTVKAVQPEAYRDCKDANDILRKYGKEAVRAAVEGARVVPVRGIVELADVENVDLYRLPKISTGIKQLDAVFSGGLCRGTVAIISGKRGDGKSTFASMILANALNAGKTILAYSGELPNHFFKAWIDRQLAGQQNMIDRFIESGGEGYYLPKSKAEILSEWYRGRAFLYDNSSLDDEELPSLLETLEKAIAQYAPDVVLIDNLMTALDVELGVDLYRAQSKFVDKVVKMAKRFNTVVLLVVHPRKNRAGNDSTDEVAGSADITNKVDIVMTYSRLGGGVPGDSENERLLSVSKNRLTGKLAEYDKAITLYYDPASKRISDEQRNFRQAFGWENVKAKDFQEGFEPMPEDEQLVFE